MVKTVEQDSTKNLKWDNLLLSLKSCHYYLIWSVKSWTRDHSALHWVDIVTQEPLYKSKQWTASNCLNHLNRNASASAFRATATPSHVWAKSRCPLVQPLLGPSIQRRPTEAPHRPQPPRTKATLWLLPRRTQGPDVLEVESSRGGGQTFSGRIATNSCPSSSQSQSKTLCQLYASSWFNLWSGWDKQ